MISETKTYQTIVIGAGSGGMTVAIGLAGLGRRVAMIEGKFIGGDCTNVGCVPSKTLIHLVNDRDVELPSQSVLVEVQTKRNQLRDRETVEVEHMENLDLIWGKARFLAPKRLEVTQPDGSLLELSADNIVIATGSRPRHMDIAGLPTERMLTNESLFEIEDAPRHLVIVGSGVIAMEMAFAFRKLGSQVSVITRGGRVMSSAISEAAEALHTALTERDIAVYYNAKPQSYDEATNTLHILTNGVPATIEGADRVLLAVGRVRNIDTLNLEQAGVAFDDKDGIKIDSYGQTNVPGIYAIGDVTPTSHFTHSANAQGRRVVQKIAFPFLPASSPEPFYPSATFSDPEVARVGLTPEQIAERYHPKMVKRLRVELSALDRGYTDGVTTGFIIVDAVRLTGRILAVTIVGPRASEILSFFTLAITEKISLYKIYRLVYPYPTFSGGIQKVADAFMRETLPNLKAEILNYIRYRFVAPPRQSGQKAGARLPQA
ncbi:MAG: NAD(P)/FAD-dependent oxidoreductase [Chloroflexales bacterium]|nr:NAD(P)/FAD-dependent oxidoreductase [Chloroflexales bacterium]